MIHVDVQGNLQMFQGSVGVMGTLPAPHHGRIARDGVTYIQDHNAYVEEWQVLDTEPKLFVEARYPQYPEKCIPAVVENRARRHLREDSIHANEACSHVTGPEWEFCILDVTATGDYGIGVTVYG